MTLENLRKYKKKMEIFKLQDEKLNEKLQEILELYGHRLTYDQIRITKLVFVRLKKYIDDEQYLVFCVLYGLYYFKIIDKNNPLLTNEDTKKIDILTTTLKAEVSGDIETFFQNILSMEEKLFVFKIILKSIIILEPKIFGKIIPNVKQYYRAIGWLIPILSYKHYPKLLSQFQDFYFETIYPREYKWIRKQYKKDIEKVTVIENLMVDVINDLSRIMQKIGVCGLVMIRRKTYFSVYNKIKRKKGDSIYDFIGVRIIFNTINDLNLFVENFEKRFIIETKKDFIKHPKPNGYKSLHYTFLYNFESNNYNTELQIRTKKMDKDTYENTKISHFSYSLKRKKWDEVFKEVQDGVYHTTKYLEEHGKITKNTSF
ncbi:MAG: hypothetical protein N4A38_05550 [Candidatus Gracilibacteria bacterium]|nr:hypothetical protein [Candidatus Gracilibacteria bacterium]